MACYGEQRLTQYIINYCFDSINRIDYDMRVCTYCYGEHYVLFSTVTSNKQNPAPLKRAHSPQGMLSCQNPDLLKYTHSPQGMLSLISPTECCVMKRKDGECPVPEAKLHTRHNILSFHYVRSMISQGYINLQHLSSEWNFAHILAKNWSYQSSYYELIQLVYVFCHSGNTAALFLGDTLEVDVSIVEGSVFGILGREKRSEKSMNGIRVCGQTIVETSMYPLTTDARVLRN